VVLTNVQVLAAGTKIERDTDKDKPVAVSVVTLLVDPEEPSVLTLAATKARFSSRSEPARQDHAR
jgi:Flp pilus assembly protein CpaB